MIRVNESPIDAGAELAKFEARAAGVGAVVSFTGRVRAESMNDRVQALRLEHYPGVTERAIGTVEAKARARWGLDDVVILHRVGAIAPGETIVFVAAASAHRRAAFEAADYLMDYLKTEALFWKMELRDRGEAWIEPRSEDYADAARWKEDD